jgi:cytochrome c-type biogenesis protein
VNGDVSIPASFIAGMLSFLSPCVLPVVSSWLVMLGGERTDTAEGQRVKDSARESGAEKRRFFSACQKRMVVSTLFFILGFSLVFVVLSIVFSGFMLFLGNLNTIINYIAGGIVVILGLNILFNFIPFLNYEKRFHTGKNLRGWSGHLLAGIGFGAGWTPCIGPVLGGILLMASSGTLLQAVFCLAAYSAGLGLPFLAASVFWGAFINNLAKLKKILPFIPKVSGVFVIAMGVFIMTGRFSAMSGFFLKNGYALGRWAESGDPAVRFLPAAVFLLAGILPPLISGIKKHSIKSSVIVCSAVFAVLAIGQAAGLLNCIGLISRWLVFN